jgi:hypothetical protein
MKNKFSQLIDLSVLTLTQPFNTPERAATKIISFHFLSIRNFPLMLCPRSKIERLYFSSA